jgi:2,4-didehydro-3-deoxy-L-rhamnonate hydrolase
MGIVTAPIGLAETGTTDDLTPFALGMFSVAGCPPFLGIVLGDDAVVALHALAPLASTLGARIDGRQTLFQLLQDWDYNFAVLCRLVRILADDAAGHGFRGSITASELLNVHAPVNVPRQIVCAIDTYGPSAARSARDLRFVARLPSTLCGPTDKIILPASAAPASFGVQLGAVFGRTARNVPLHQSMRCIAGYTVVNSIALRASEGEEDNAFAALGAPTFLPTGPLFVPAPFLPDPHRLALRLSINGTLMQDANTAAMSCSIAEQITHLTAQCMMLPGDLLCTGTPAIVAIDSANALLDGDLVEAAIEGLGRQNNNVILERRENHADQWH